jgi:xanthine dehydrogenase accessory factor
MRDWLATLEEALRRDAQPIVRVVVAATRGSAPREAGASMLVSAGREWGTIGGGHLELVATRTARDILAGSRESPRRDRFALGASLGQCCGGIVELWFERYDTSDLAALGEALRLRAAGSPDETLAALVSRDPNAARYERFAPALTPLWLFGAGHVGSAVVNVLSALPFAITWVDSREGQIPDPLPENVRALHSPQPAEEVPDMPAGAFALVMTHSHDEDLAIAAALLASGAFAWAGVIGSMPKTKRFRQRLAERGFAEDRIARLTMPVGIGGIRSKEPAAIAVAVAAQLLQEREARALGADSLMPQSRAHETAREP